MADRDVRLTPSVKHAHLGNPDRASVNSFADYDLESWILSEATRIPKTKPSRRNCST
jgi:hypothetical protein